MFMTWKERRAVLMDVAGEGGGAGAAGEGETTSGEGEATGEGEGEATSWLDGIDGIEDDDRSFVGERSPKDLITYARQQRQAASARAEKVAEEGGFIKMPEPDASDDVFKEHFSQYRPETTEDYVSIAGFKTEDMSVSQKMEVEAAHAAGMHPKQFRDYQQSRADQQADADAKAADELMGAIRQDWGADMELNAQLVDRAVTALDLGEEFVAAISAPHSGFTPANHKALMDGLLKVGSFLREGGPVGDAGNDAAGAMDAETERANLEAIQINGGTLSPSQEERMKVLNQKIAEGKAA